jgi:hypothetical protein
VPKIVLKGTGMSTAKTDETTHSYNIFKNIKCIYSYLVNTCKNP